MSITSVNDTPTISVAEGGSCSRTSVGGAMNLTIGDVEKPAGSLPLRRVSSKTGVVPINNITFGGSGANRIVTIAPVVKKSSDSATITVTVDDGQGGTATTTIKVTVGTTKNETINGHTFCRRWAAKRLRRWMQPYPERGHAYAAAAARERLS